MDTIFYSLNTNIMVGAGALSLMTLILAFFYEDLVQSKNKIRDNFISNRKKSIRKISQMGEASKELIQATKKGFFARRREAIELLIFKSDMKITYHEYVIICITLGVIGIMIGDFMNNWGIGAVLAFVFYTLPKSYLNFVCDSVRRQIDEQLEPVLSQIIGLIPTKKTLTNACESCLDSMEDPLKTFFTEFINNVNNANRSFDESINELAKKIDTKPFYDFTRLAIIHYKQGGDTMYAFSAIPENIRDIKLIQSEQEAELDSLKILGYMFVLSTPLSYFYYYFIDKDSFNVLINTMPGKIISFMALIITLITIKLIAKISKPIEL